MQKLSYQKIKNNHALWLKVVPALFILSIIILTFGILGLIEHKSPTNLASLNTLSSSFITHFEYHIMIIIGALIFTLSIWISKYY
jgi:hypothetical protein